MSTESTKTSSFHPNAGLSEAKKVVSAPLNATVHNNLTTPVVAETVTAAAPAAPAVSVVKDVYTTGEAAEICKVSQQTIIRCFDAGRLGGFRVPGSKFRRIPRDAMVKFMKDNGIPLDNLDSGRRKVLVVDDDAEIVELFVDVLNRDGRFEVKTAASGYDAGVLTQEFAPDLMILDYMLPDINGNVVCQTVRNNPKFEHMKIIIVSGVVNQEEINELLHAGADDFVKKPFNIEKLIERMGELLQLV